MTPVAHVEDGSDYRHDDAILRVASYRRRDWDLFAIHCSPREHAPVRPSIQKPFPRPSSASLGALGRLPPELLLTVLRSLDVLSIFRLRHVNGLARSVVSEWPAYRALATHALDAFRSILRTGVASRFALDHVYRLLYVSDRCVVCGNVGPLLVLPTLQRCCYRCLRNAPDFRVASLHSVTRRSGSSASKPRTSLVVVHTVPGRYAQLERARNRRLHLVSVAAALSTLQLSVYPEEPPGDEKEVLRCMAAAAFPFINHERDRVEASVCCKGCQVAVEEDTGGSPGLFDRRDRSYSPRGFLEHFKGCSEAQALWEASCRGTVPIAEPEFTRRRGFLSGPD